MIYEVVAVPKCIHPPVGYVKRMRRTGVMERQTHCRNGRPLSHHYQNGKRRLCRGVLPGGGGTETKQICGPVWHRLPACLPAPCLSAFHTDSPDVFFVSFTFSHNCQLTAPELSPHRHRHRHRRRRW